MMGDQPNHHLDKLWGSESSVWLLGSPSLRQKTISLSQKEEEGIYIKYLYFSLSAKRMAEIANGSLHVWLLGLPGFSPWVLAHPVQPLMTRNKMLSTDPSASLCYSWKQDREIRLTALLRNVWMAYQGRLLSYSSITPGARLHKAGTFNLKVSL